MKPLILTGWPIEKFEEENLGDLQAVFICNFAWGKLPSPAKLAAHLGPRTRDRGPRQGEHWSDFASRWNLSKAKRFRDLSPSEGRRRFRSPMTRQSIVFASFFLGWMRGSSRAKTRFALLLAHDGELLVRAPHSAACA